MRSSLKGLFDPYAEVTAVGSAAAAADSMLMPATSLQSHTHSQKDIRPCMHK